MTLPGRRPDRGSATIWVLAACGIVAVVAAVAVIRGTAVLARHRVEGAADLAALAAAGQIGLSDRACHEAAAVAARNNAKLASCVLSLAADGRSGSALIRVSALVNLPVVGTRPVTASARAARLATQGEASCADGCAARTGAGRPARRGAAPGPVGRR